MLVNKIIKTILFLKQDLNNQMTHIADRVREPL